ncbi:procathepsin L-like [Antechinus flavipes]|uniref:procathepsin L-like n=1 Tax=Antechinus flavipes TaxID=38775 RepID=UPI002235B89E|nr:procathepsin L-like [Antechinus flavipes]
MKFGHKIAITKKEESFRKQVWEKNMMFINDQNLLYKEGKLSYYLGMNNLGDLTDKEFKRMLNPSMLQRVRRDTITKNFSIFSHLPKSVDWREKGFITPVRQQGRCGSCWAFSATGAVEGQLFLKTGKLVELSKQNLIDCSKFQGCRGGTVTSAFEYIFKKGIVSEECYPYVAKKNSLCSYRSECAAVKIRDYVVLPFGNEEILMKAVAIVGPVSVSLNVRKSLHFYKGGIYVEPKCKRRNTNHALLLVGYGYKEGKKDKKSRLEEENQYEETKFWILKNSWGVNWGKKGYVYIAKDKNNHCGVATRAIYPIL